MLPFLPPSPNPVPSTTLPVHHNYGTRIRQNSVIRPSARLRQSPDPPPSSLKKSKPTLSHTKPLSPDHTRTDLPIFPPPNIMLHPEDANSKVFLAIGRSFISVNNCAMTIKDLAEMTLGFGLACQNVSAAGQAITSYIRTHLQRCEDQQDHPLLLRHVLSGTPSDDDLLPALHSRSGGAHCIANPDNRRTTNFRRGTMVWYLSKATGAPCPFARAGIQLCEYGENGRVGSHADARERKKERDRLRRLQKCGQKRKRLPRGCLDPDSDSDNQTKPPPKVKLTLRLRPCLSAIASTSGTTPAQESDSEDTQDDSISVDSLSDDEDNQPSQIPQEQPWSLPPYPRRSISIPCYTPSIDSNTFPFTSSFPQPSFDPYRRSPSVPYSTASPPPNSEDEDDDYHITMTGLRSCPADSGRHRDSANTDIDADFDLDSEGEADRETQWESPGPRSPSAPLTTADVVVKQEPTDMKGILDAWEDFYFMGDSKIGSSTIYAESATTKVKVESLDSWHRHPSGYYPPILGLEESPSVKHEDLDLDSKFAFLDDLASRSEFDVSSHLPPIPFSVPERRHSEKWSVVDSDRGSPVHFRPQTSMSLPSITSRAVVPSVFPAQRQQSPLTRATASPDPEPLSPLFNVTSESLDITISPSSLVKPPSEMATTGASDTHHNSVVVVHTCQPCTPAVSATQIEGISVYQLLLGSLLLLRRIDTDFVNLTTIATHLGLSGSTLPSIPNAVVVGKGSATVRGTWVPLVSAQAFVREHPLPDDSLDVFLSDSLFERFPPALQDFHRSSTPGRLLNQFGPHFKSTMEMQRLSPLSVRTDVPRPLPQSLPLPLTPTTHSAAHPYGYDVPLTKQEQAYQWDALNDSPIQVMQVLSEVAQIVETPLSATEQEIFHALCDVTDWEKENSPPAASIQEPQHLETQKVVTLDESVIDVLSESTTANVNPAAAVTNPSADRPLRRSKRVANAMAMAVAARSRTRSYRRSTRNSLS